MHVVFKFTPEVDAQTTLKLTFEINTRGHMNRLGMKRYSFVVDNEWYQGMAEITSFEPEKLLFVGTMTMR